MGDLFDIVYPRAAGKTKLGERLYHLPEVGVVDHRRVTTDDPGSFQAVDAPFYGGRREADLAPDVPERTAGVLLKQLQDAIVRVVQVCKRGGDRNNLSLCKLW
jgi:hypothetical protein